MAMTLVVVPPSLQARAVYDGSSRNEISGTGNTLASVAEDVAGPEVFAYDPATRTAVCRALNLSVANGGELTIGVKGEKDRGETLMFECTAAPGGAEEQDEERYAFHVKRGGSLSVYHSRIEAQNGLIDRSRARHGGIEYHGLNTGEIVDSVFRNMRGLRSLYNNRIEVNGLLLDKCVIGLYLHAVSANFVGVVTREAKRAVYVKLRTRDKITFRSCHFTDGGGVRCTRLGSGTAPAVMDLVDCELPKDQEKRLSVVGTARSIGIRVFHTAKLSLLDRNGTPLSGQRIKLVSTPETEGVPEPDAAVVVTDHSGATWLPVPEYADYVSNIGKSETPQHVRYTSRLTTDSGQVLKDKWTPLERVGLVFKRSANGFRESEGTYSEGEALSVNNVILNSSFEITTCPGIPDCWSPRRWLQLTEDFMGRTSPNAPLTFLGIDRTDPYHGKQCLKIGPNAGPIMKKPIWHEGGRTYTFSAYMRSDVPGTEAVVSFQHGSGQPPWSFELTREWKRYHFTVAMKKNFVVHLINQGPGEACIDAVQMEESDELHPYVVDNYKPVVY